MEQPCLTRPKFDKKYKIIIATDKEFNLFDMLDWINLHSTDSVDIKTITDEKGHPTVYFAFESSDDALVFRIRYSI